MVHVEFGHLIRKTVFNFSRALVEEKSESSTEIDPTTFSFKHRLGTVLTTDFQRDFWRVRSYLQEIRIFLSHAPLR